jgi:hypothetical protein
MLVEGTEEEWEKTETLSFDGDVLRVDGGETTGVATGARAAARAENESREDGSDEEGWVTEVRGELRGV